MTCAQDNDEYCHRSGRAAALALVTLGFGALLKNAMTEEELFFAIFSSQVAGAECLTGFIEAFDTTEGPEGR